MTAKTKQIEAAMHSIAAKYGNHLNENNVIEEVKKLPKSHPIHEHFMGWDEAKLAAAKALDIARELIGQYIPYIVTRYAIDIPGRAFVRNPDLPGNVSGFIRTTAMTKRQAYAAMENELAMVESDVAAARIRIASMDKFPELVEAFEDRLRALFPPRPKKRPSAGGKGVGGSAPPPPS